MDHLQPVAVDGWRLVHADTGDAVSRHQEVKDFRGDRGVITGGRPPAGFGKSGYVWTAEGAEFYPSVFGLKWVPAF